jgi:hypothetical protein
MPRGRSKAYANRTDLTGKVPVNAPTGMPYGENKKLRDAQKDIPMANPDAPMPTASSQPMMTQVKSVPLTAETQRPNEDIMTGLNTTPVPNSDLQKLKSYQPLFEMEALSEDAPETFRQFVSWLRTQ